jgi:5-methylthioadenosine/S-adenosylhomocysteine deaminase
VKIVVEPHSLYTCSPALLKDAKALADAYGIPVATHFLENMTEPGLIKQKLGQRATDFLLDIGYLNERFIAFHGVYMDNEDIRIFADHGCKVVHNPESNMKLASGVAPVSRMLEAGIVVGLGTDGCASNNNLDMFQEIDTAAKLEKSVLLNPTIMPARTVLRMATCDGAKVLGLDNIVGAIRPGMKADLVMIRLDKPHLTPMYSEYSHLVYAVNGSDVDTVFINGKLIMENRVLLTIDVHETMERVRRIAERVKRSMAL